MTVHHLEQTDPKNEAYDNEILLCHNCHVSHHQQKGASAAEPREIKRRLIVKTLTRPGLNALKETYRRGRVVAMPFLVNHLVEFGYLVFQQELSSWSDDHSHRALLGLPILLVIVAGINWPFVFLFFVNRIRARRERAPRLSAKTSNVCATLAMVAPVIFFLLVWHEQTLAPANAGDGAGLALGFVFIVVPIAGLIGYGLGEVLGKCIMVAS